MTGKIEEKEAVEGDGSHMQLAPTSEIPHLGSSVISSSADTSAYPPPQPFLSDLNLGHSKGSWSLCFVNLVMFFKLQIDVAEKVLDMDLHDAGNYVQLANMFLEANMREKVENVWRMMRERWLVKTPGCSSIEPFGISRQPLATPTSSWEAPDGSFGAPVRSSQKSNECVKGLNFCSYGKRNIMPTYTKTSTAAAR